MSDESYTTTVTPIFFRLTFSLDRAAICNAATMQQATTTIKRSDQFLVWRIFTTTTSLLVVAVLP